MDDHPLGRLGFMLQKISCYIGYTTDNLFVKQCHSGYAVNRFNFGIIIIISLLEIICNLFTA